MNPIQKAMELEMKYKSCLDSKIFATIPNEDEREICRAAARLCDYDKDQFYGALLHLLSR
ncbi:hypothetical protein RA19_23755 [Leisingera sp. ANG-M1]|nr:hypothetical protein RA19_23755 [Leisingera sp. ANG-M1]